MALNNTSSSSINSTKVGGNTHEKIRIGSYWYPRYVTWSQLIDLVIPSQDVNHELLNIIFLSLPSLDNLEIFLNALSSYFFDANKISDDKFRNAKHLRVLQIIRLWILSPAGMADLSNGSLMESLKEFLKKSMEISSLSIVTEIRKVEVLLEKLSNQIEAIRTQSEVDEAIASASGKLVPSSPLVLKSKGSPNIHSIQEEMNVDLSIGSETDHHNLNNLNLRVTNNKLNAGFSNSQNMLKNGLHVQPYVPTSPDSNPTGSLPAETTVVTQPATNICAVSIDSLKAVDSGSGIGSEISDLAQLSVESSGRRRSHDAGSSSAGSTNADTSSPRSPSSLQSQNLTPSVKDDQEKLQQRQSSGTSSSPSLLSLSPQATYWKNLKQRAIQKLSSNNSLGSFDGGSPKSKSKPNSGADSGDRTETGAAAEKSPSSNNTNNNNNNNNNNHKIIVNIIKNFSNRNVSDIVGFINESRSGSSIVQDVDFYQLAEVLTAIELQDLRSVRPRELVRMAWTRNDLKPLHADLGGSRNLYQLVVGSQQRIAWISREIVRYGATVGPTSQCIEYFIRVAKSCRTMNNFSTIFQVVLALEMPAVKHLKVAWSSVSQEKLQEMNKLIELCSDKNDYKKYREEIEREAAEHHPRIPWIEIITRDLTFLDGGEFFKKKTNVIDLKQAVKRYQIIFSYLNSHAGCGPSPKNFTSFLEKSQETGAPNQVRPASGGHNHSSGAVSKGAISPNRHYGSFSEMLHMLSTEGQSSSVSTPPKPKSAVPNQPSALAIGSFGGYANGEQGSIQHSSSTPTNLQSVEMHRAIPSTSAHGPFGVLNKAGSALRHINSGSGPALPPPLPQPATVRGLSAEDIARIPYWPGAIDKSGYTLEIIGLDVETRGRSQSRERAVTLSGGGRQLSKLRSAQSAERSIFDIFPSLDSRLASQRRSTIDVTSGPNPVPRMTAHSGGNPNLSPLPEQPEISIHNFQSAHAGKPKEQLRSQSSDNIKGLSEKPSPAAVLTRQHSDSEPEAVTPSPGIGNLKNAMNAAMNGLGVWGAAFHSPSLSSTSTTSPSRNPSKENGNSHIDHSHQKRHHNEDSTSFQDAEESIESSVNPISFDIVHEDHLDENIFSHTNSPMSSNGNHLNHGFSTQAQPCQEGSSRLNVNVNPITVATGITRTTSFTRNQSHSVKQQRESILETFEGVAVGCMPRLTRDSSASQSSNQLWNASSAIGSAVTWSAAYGRKVDMYCMRIDNKLLVEVQNAYRSAKVDLLKLWEEAKITNEVEAGRLLSELALTGLL